MNFKGLIAKFATGNLSYESLPEVGMKAIEEGLNSPSLYILAGLLKNESSFEIESYFLKTLEELNITFPDKRTAALQYAVAIAEEILIDREGVMPGLSEIIYKAFCHYDFDSESKLHGYNTIGFYTIRSLYERNYDLYDSIDHLKNEKSNFELIFKNERELKIELKNWVEKFYNGDFNLPKTL